MAAKRNANVGVARNDEISLPALRFARRPRLVSMPIVFSTPDREQKVDQDTAENKGEGNQKL